MECQVDVSDDLAVGANRRELEDEDEYNLDDDLISYSDIASVSAFSAPSQMSVRDEVRVTQPNRGRRGKKDLKALPNPAEPVDRDTQVGQGLSFGGSVHVTEQRQAMIDQLEQSVDASAAEDGWRTIGPAKPKRLPRGRPT